MGQSEGFENTGRLSRDVEKWREKRITKREGNSLSDKNDKIKICDSEKFESLNVGCTGVGRDTMEFQSSCGPETNSGFCNINNIERYIVL